MGAVPGRRGGLTLPARGAGDLPARAPPGGPMPVAQRESGRLQNDQVGVRILAGMRRRRPDADQMWPKPKQSRRQVVALVLGGASPPGHPKRPAPGFEIPGAGGRVGSGPKGGRAALTRHVQVRVLAPQQGHLCTSEVGLLRRRGFLRLIIGWLRVRVPPPGIAGRSSTGRAPVSSVAWFSGRYSFQPARGERRGSFHSKENTTSPASGSRAGICSGQLRRTGFLLVRAVRETAGRRSARHRPSAMFPDRP